MLFTTENFMILYHMQYCITVFAEAVKLYHTVRLHTHFHLTSKTAFTK